LAGVPQGEVAAAATPVEEVKRHSMVVSGQRKRPRQARPFISYPLLSEYQVQPKNRPNIFEGIVVEVVSYEGQNFRTVREKLDKFSTFSGLGCK
jgi:hypothetical protein